MEHQARNGAGNLVRCRAFSPLAISLLMLAGAAVAQGDRVDQIFIHDRVVGSQSVGPGERGSSRAEYSFNDRGRGDHILASWKLDAAGVPVEYSGKGNDYMKAPVSESFRLENGIASWSLRSERGSAAVHGEAFYVPLNAPPEFLGVLARALLRAPGHRLALLPSGTASIEEAGSVTVQDANSRDVMLTQYRIHGLDLGPTPLWLDPQGHSAAMLSGWMSVLSPSGVHSLEPLRHAQDGVTSRESARLAARLTHVPAGDLVIRGARLFDPRDLVIQPGMSVLVRGERIVRVAPDSRFEVPAGAEVLDARGRFLMPGLWDNHEHFDDHDGALDLANGVTSARDMANDTDTFLERVARFDAGTELGPRVFKAGIIDGPGPLAGPTRMLADNPADALRIVAWYADHGYGQIKIYSSVAPALVPVIADAAHARGLRVSGHVPAFLSAREFVEAGADEIQHLNFIVLNFLADTVKDTRNMTRLTAVAEHARDFPPENPRVREFIAFLANHHTVLDPTLNVFEANFCGDPAATTPGLEEVAPRMPPQLRRTLLSGALVAPPGQQDAYREAFPSMLRLLKALHDAGVTIIPGTDSFPGYSLLHELELYVRAGIPAPEVLRMATLTSAQVVGVDRERGTIAAGKLADMILVDGDPSRNISDLRHITTVIKGGRVFDPARIEEALGIVPRAPPAP